MPFEFGSQPCESRLPHFIGKSSNELNPDSRGRRNKFKFILFCLKEVVGLFAALWSRVSTATRLSVSCSRYLMRGIPFFCQACSENEMGSYMLRGRTRLSPYPVLGPGCRQPSIVHRTFLRVARRSRKTNRDLPFPGVPPRR